MRSTPLRGDLPAVLGCRAGRTFAVRHHEPARRFVYAFLDPRCATDGPRSAADVGPRGALSTPDGIVNAVSGLSFHALARRDARIVGESRREERTTSHPGLLKPQGTEIDGEVLFEGGIWLKATSSQIRASRQGHRDDLQDPFACLHPM